MMIIMVKVKKKKKSENNDYKNDLKLLCEKALIHKNY
jgi:hypothetical protein